MKQIEKLQINYHSKAIGIGVEDFPTSLGSWGSLLTQYYDGSREELPGEIIFWKNQIKDSKNILEIGAGTGFISKHLIEDGRTLTLVEPEVENMRLLKLCLKEFEKNNTRINYVPYRFERCQVQPQDYIFFPYDSLPMISSSEQRALIIEHAAKNLKTGGKFGVHVSTRSWANRLIESSKGGENTEIKVKSGTVLEVSKIVEPLSKNDYLKLISIKDSATQKKEIYLARTSIVDPDEIEDFSKRVGLKLVERHFSFIQKEVLDDDIILVFKKD